MVSIVLIISYQKIHVPCTFPAPPPPPKKKRLFPENNIVWNPVLYTSSKIYQGSQIDFKQQETKRKKPAQEMEASHQGLGAALPLMIYIIRDMCF